MSSRCTNKSGIHLTLKSRQACPLHGARTGPLYRARVAGSGRGTTPVTHTPGMPSLFNLVRESAEAVRDAKVEHELRSLATDKSDVTRRVAAMNEACPPDAVRALADDLSEIVRMAVARRKHVDPDVLAHIAKNDPCLLYTSPSPRD